MFARFIKSTLFELVRNDYILFYFISGPCPDSWIPGVYGSCYRISSNTLGWNSAKSACEALGSRLAVLHSQEELQLLERKGAENTWIGLHRDSKDKSLWLWVDGSHAIYTNWYHGKPSDSEGKKDCAEIVLRSFEGKWNDRKCNDSLRFICEISRKSENVLK